MPVFQYTVRDATGNVRTGTSEAESQDLLKRRLQEQGFTVSDVKQTAANAKKKGVGWGSVKLKDLSIFCRQFSTMVDAGVSLVRSPYASLDTQGIGRVRVSLDGAAR